MLFGVASAAGFLHAAVAAGVLGGGSLGTTAVHDGGRILNHRAEHGFQLCELVCGVKAFSCECTAKLIF